MECTSKGLNKCFLDRPEQGRCIFHISSSQPQGMLKFMQMEDPVKWVIFFEFIGPCHINADIRVISTKSSPELSSTCTEGDGRTMIFSQQEIGPPERAVDHMNRKSISIGGLITFPKMTFHRHKMIPKDGDQAVLIPCPVCPASFEGFGGTWPTGQGRIEN